MRVIDLFLPYLDELQRVDDLGGGMLRYLAVPPGRPDPERVIEGEATPERPRGAGDASCVLLSANPWDPSWLDLDEALRRATSGALFFVFVGAEILNWPGTRLLALCSEHGAQVVDAVPLSYDSVKLAFVVRRTEEPVAPARYLSDGRTASAADERRMRGEGVMVDVVSRALQDQVRVLEDELRRRQIDLSRLTGLERHVSQETESASSLRRVLEEEKRNHHDLRREAEAAIDELRTSLRRALRQQVLAERRLAQVEASTSLRVGQALVSAAREPRALVRLPGRLRTAWSDREADVPEPDVGDVGGIGILPQAPARSFVAVTDRDRGPRRLDRAVSADDRLRLAVIAPDEVAAELSQVADVNVLRPETQALVGETDFPDALVLMAGVGSAAGPWFGLGTFAGAHYDRLVTDLVRRCSQLSIPTGLVLDRSTHECPTLGHLRDVVDAVFGVGEDVPSWSVGTSLSRWYRPSGPIEGGELMRVVTGAKAGHVAALREGGVTTLATSPLCREGYAEGADAEMVRGRLMASRGLVLLPGDVFDPETLAARATLAGIPVISVQTAVADRPGVHQVADVDEVGTVHLASPGPVDRHQTVVGLIESRRTTSDSLAVLADVLHVPYSQPQVTAVLTKPFPGHAGALIEMPRRPDRVIAPGIEERELEELELAGIDVGVGGDEESSHDEPDGWTLQLSSTVPHELGSVVALVADGTSATAIEVGSDDPVRLLRNHRLSDPTARAWLEGRPGAHLVDAHHYPSAEVPA